MELALLIWLGNALDSIRVFVGVLSVIAVLVGTIQLMDLHMNPRDDSWWRVFLVSGLIGILLTCIIPSRQTMWMMAGGYVAQATYQSAIGVKIHALIELQLTKMIDEQTAELTKPAK